MRRDIFVANDSIPIRGLMMFQYDLVVVGSGPAGRRGAIQAAKLGKKVLVIEQGKRVGGVSVHTGTIPSKTLRETALNLFRLARTRFLRPIPTASSRRSAPKICAVAC